MATNEGNKGVYLKLANYHLAFGASEFGDPHLLIRGTTPSAISLAPSESHPASREKRWLMKSKIWRYTVEQHNFRAA
jgi:hypothetical protein